MNIADRLHNLRKSKGISQEELADKIGVSRQAVSKWESEQSIPDLDKVVLLSEYFQVTTDYILKGIEKTGQLDEKKPDANVFVISATVLNFIGLIISCAVWYEKQTAMALVLGMGFMALGCMIFGVGMLKASEPTKAKGKYNFWSINIWLLVFIPLSFIYNVLFTGQSAPYPILVSPAILFLVFWLVYFAISIGVVMAMLKGMRRT